MRLTKMRPTSWLTNWRKWIFPLVIALALAIGIFARTEAWLSIRSLWGDEACLANNILSRPIAGLLQPLDDNQGAPIGFLVAVKMMINLFGVGERIFRLVPYLAGLVSLPLFYFVARRTLDKWGLAFGLIYFALQPTMVHYSAEFKQYSVDAAVTLVLLLIGLIFLKGKRTWSQVAWLAGAGVVAVWCSFPSVFILAGIGTTWALIEWKQFRKLPWSKLALTAFLWLASFAGVYRLSVTGLLQNSYLTGFWDFGFPAFPPTNWTDLRWYLEIPINLVNITGVNPYWGAAAVFLVLGAIFWIRDNDIEAPLFLLPFAFLFAASIAKVYPFASRMIFFTFPLGVLLTARGVQEVLRFLPRWKLVSAIAITLLINAFPLAEAVDPSLMVFKREEIGPLLNFVRRNWSAGDLIFANKESGCNFLYYAQQKGIPPTEYQFSQHTFRNNLEEWPAQFAGEVDALQLDHDRVWFLLAHNHEDILPKALEILRARGTELTHLSLEGADVYLFDLY